MSSVEGCRKKSSQRLTVLVLASVCP